MNTTRQQKHNWSYSCKQDIPGTRLLQQQDFRSVDQPLSPVTSGTYTGRSRIAGWKTWASSQTARSCAPMAASLLPLCSTDTEQGGARSIARTIRHSRQYWSPQSNPCSIGHWESRWALEKKQQTLCSPLEAQWQEGAGGLLLVAAAQETGLLPALETALASCTPQDHSRLAHLSPLSGRMLMLTFLSLGVVGLRRTWDLRSYTGDALGLLSGRKRAYGYLHTERLLSEVARAQGDEVFTDALARWTAQLWQMPELEPGSQPASFYVDGHRKPVYTGALIPRGLVGRLSTILGCRALVLLHDEHGHPLLATTHRGDQHLTIRLPVIVRRYEEHMSTGAIQQIIVDREGMAAEFLAKLVKEGRTAISILRTDQYTGLDSFTDIGDFIPWCILPEGTVLREVAPATFPLPLPDQKGQFLPLRVALIRDLHR